VSLDPAAVRADFPTFEALGGEPFHYLDNAATGQICRPAADALLAYETTSRANVKRGLYRLAERATIAFEEARAAIARYVGAADPDEIVFTSGTTYGINLVAHSFGQSLREGDEVVVSYLEHHSNIVPWQLLRDRTGVGLKVLPVTDEGRLDLDRLDEVVTPRCRLIAVTHCSNVTGAVTDVARIVEAARAVGARVLLDGAQRAAHGPLDVQGLGVDFYAISGHKMFGPTGSGALWVRGELLRDLPPFLGGGEMIRTVTFERTTYAAPPHRFEAGTPGIGAAIGLGGAAGWAAAFDWRAAVEHELRLTARLLDGLAEIDGVRVLGPAGTQGRLGVVSFATESAHPHDVAQLLDGRGVCVRAGHHCAQPLMERFDLAATARASLAPYNDDADVDIFLDGLDAALRRLR
jgi:cysteine desulfurase / selenocysteine lyase